MAHVLITRVVPTVFLALGLYLLVAGIRDGLEAYSSRSWPAVPGTVIRSELGYADDPKIGRPGSYRPRVEYEYRVAGRRYRASRIGIVAVGTSRRADAEAVLESYPKGSAVSVHHHPRRPDRAFLEVGFSWDLLPTLGLGLFSAGLGAGFLIGFRRSNSGASTSPSPADP